MMLSNDSPSFFEKLTGAVKAVPPVSPPPPPPPANGEAHHIQKDYKEAGPAPVEITSKKMPKPPLVPKEEEEGQLTIDVYQTENEIVIKSPVAGVKPQDLDVTITNDMVTIKGRRESDEEVLRESYFFQELYWGPFSRSVILPTEIEMEEAKAILKDGILTIRLPRVEKETAKKLSIQMG
ncbi:MAG: Hsp20/alpha crystallin family protein [Candidatus Portnoybacteria bacterium]|nr:Hsp20/alpha crystallin family protein [Candidatus Portnoybacteria bacterium]